MRDGLYAERPIEFPPSNACRILHAGDDGLSVAEDRAVRTHPWETLRPETIRALTAPIPLEGSERLELARYFLATAAPDEAAAQIALAWTQVDTGNKDRTFEHILELLGDASLPQDARSDARAYFAAFLVKTSEGMAERLPLHLAGSARFRTLARLKKELDEQRQRVHEVARRDAGKDGAAVLAEIERLERIWRAPISVALSDPLGSSLVALLRLRCDYLPRLRGGPATADGAEWQALTDEGVLRIQDLAWASQEKALRRHNRAVARRNQSILRDAPAAEGPSRSLFEQVNELRAMLALPLLQIDPALWQALQSAPDSLPKVQILTSPPGKESLDPWILSPDSRELLFSVRWERGGFGQDAAGASVIALGERKIETGVTPEGSR